MDEGIEIHPADDKLVEFTRQFVENDVKTIARHYAERYGLKETEQNIQKFQQLLERWVELGNEIDGKAAFQEILWREIYSKVDVSRYGL